MPKKDRRYRNEAPRPSYSSRQRGRTVQHDQDNPVPMKKFYQSKTIWAAALTILLAVYRSVAKEQGWPTDFIPTVETVLIGLGLYGLRAANTTIQGTQHTPGPGSAQQPNNVVPGPAMEDEYDAENRY